MRFFQRFASLAAIGAIVAAGSLTQTLTASAQGTTELVMPLIGTATEIGGWKSAVDAANTLLAPKNIHIKVQVVTTPDWTQYYQKITAMMAAGQTLDLGRIAESQMPVVIANDQAVDLTNNLKSDFDMSQYFESTFKSAAYQNGHYYGLPSGVYHMLLYYNKDLFDKASLPYPSTDWTNAITLDQVRQDALKLTQGDGASKTWGFSAGPYMAFIGMYAVSGGGDNVFHSDGTCAMTEPQAVNAYTWFDNMLRVDKTSPRPTDTKILGALDLFKAGRLAMTVDGTWDQGPYQQIKNFKVGIAAVPSVSGKAYSSQFVDSWVMWKGTQHPQEAWEALKALAGVEAAQALAKAGVGGITIRRDLLSTLQDTLIGSSFDSASKDAFVKGLDHTLAVPYNQYYNEIDVKVNNTLDDFLLGNETPSQFAQKVCDLMTQTIAAGGGTPAATSAATVAPTMTATAAATASQ